MPDVDPDSARMLDRQNSRQAGRDFRHPLQEIASIYVDAVLAIVSYFGSRPTRDRDSTVRNIEEIVEEAVTRLQHQIEAYMQRRDSLREQARRLSSPRRDVGSPSQEGGGQVDAHARFRRIGWLGKGSFGDVDEVEETSTHAVYARKYIKAYGSSTAAEREEETRNEVTIMQKLTHQHIVTVLFWLKEPKAFSIFMKPVADYDLRVFLERCTEKNYPDQSVEMIFPWFGCLLDALRFAHHLSVMHRDIKPLNILIKDKHVYLADFGVAKDFGFEGTSSTKDYFIYGTPVYRAPETRPGNPRGRSADIFSLGCVFAEMLTVASGRSLEEFQDWRKTPETECGQYAFRENLGRVKTWLTKLEKDNLSAHVSYQISKMIQEDPNRRTSAQAGVELLANHKQLLFCTNHY